MPAPATDDLGRNLAAYTRALWRFWRETPLGRTFRALVAEAQASDAALEALRTRFLPEHTQPLRRIFERGAARGDIRPADLDVLLELYLGFNWLHLLTGRIDDDPARIERMARILAGGSSAAVPRPAPKRTARSR